MKVTQRSINLITNVINHKLMEIKYIINLEILRSLPNLEFAARFATESFSCIKFLCKIVSRSRTWSNSSKLRKKRLKKRKNYYERKEMKLEKFKRKVMQERSRFWAINTPTKRKLKDLKTEAMS